MELPETTIDTLKSWSQILLWISIILPILGAVAGGARYYVERHEKKLSAGLAATRIQHAASEASAARMEAKNAKEAQSILSANLAKSEAEIVRLSGETHQLQKQAQPRAPLSAGIDKFNTLLRPYIGYELAIEAIGGNHEAMILARDVFDRFRNAGLVVPAQPGTIISPDTWSGIVVEVSDTTPPGYGDAIVMSLAALALQARKVNGAEKVVRVRIGVK